MDYAHVPCEQDAGILPWIGTDVDRHGSRARIAAAGGRSLLTCRRLEGIDLELDLAVGRGQEDHALERLGHREQQSGARLAHHGAESQHDGAAIGRHLATVGAGPGNPEQKHDEE